MLIPVKLDVGEYSTYSSYDDRYLPAEVVVMHSGLNRKGTYFSEQAIKSAEWSLKDIPILGFVKETDDGYDFDGHNMEIVKEDGVYQLKKLTKIIGRIPDNAVIKYLDLSEDGNVYVVTDGKLYSKYLDKELDILVKSPTKSVSMEIEVDDAYIDEDDGSVHIEKYRYLGIVVLGDDVSPGMKGARIVIGDPPEQEYSANTNNEKEDGEEMGKDKVVVEDVKEMVTVEEEKVETVEEVEVKDESAVEEVDTQEVEEEVAEVESETITKDEEDESEKETEESESDTPDPVDIKELLAKLSKQDKELFAYREKERLAEINQVIDEYEKLGYDLTPIRKNIGDKTVEETKAEIGLYVLDLGLKNYQAEDVDKNEEDKFYTHETAKTTTPYGSLGKELESLRKK